MVDNSGVRVYYKQGIPTVTLSTLFLGDGNVRFGNAENSYMKSKSIALNNDKDKDTFKSVYKYEATCPSECTKRLKQSIWIDAAGPHMHS